MTTTPRNRFILLTTTSYVLLALAWIFLSDRLLATFIDIKSIIWLSTVKSEFAAIATAAMFLIALRTVPPANFDDNKTLLGALATRASSTRLPRWLVYLFAVGLTVAMLFVRQYLSVFFGERPLLVLFMFVIILSAFIGGLGPGLVATLVATLGEINLVMLPMHNFRAIAGHTLFQLIFLVLNGSVVSLLSEFLRQTKAKASIHRRLLDAVVSGTSDLIFVKDTKGHYLLVNQALAELVGKPIDKILGRHDRFVLPEPWSRAAIDRDQMIIASGCVHTFEEHVAIKDGRDTVFLVTQGPVFDDAGQVYGIFGISRDITERKQAEETLRKIDSNFRNMLDSMLEGCQIVDFDWRYRYINVAAQEQNRRPSEEILGKVVMECWPDFTETEIFALEKTCMEQRTMQRGDFEFSYPNGSKRWFRVIVQPINEGIAVFSEDITERKQTEADLRVAAASFDSQEAMMVTDADKTILRVNRAFTEITGYMAEEAVGQPLHFLQSDRHDEVFHREIWSVVHSTGRWNGEVWDQRKNGEVYPTWLTISSVKDEQGTVTNYIGTHYDITERKNTEDKIVSLAFFDPLTGLPNRTLLMDRLKQAITANSRSNNYGALLFIDLDNFKTLNDTLGHYVGDLLLKQVSQRLAACMREGDTLARVSGDEFVAVLAGISPIESDAIVGTELAAENMLSMLRPVYYIGNHAYQSTASIGATLFKGQPATVDELMKQADLAMYRAKEGGRNTFRFFDSAMQTVVVERVALEADLRKAIESEQFLLYYQAQVVSGGAVTGAEVLVRWQHPQRGIVSPAEFIPLAEETGLILPLGHWILKTACIQLAKWATQPEMAHLTIAVNVSARQFEQPDFVSQVQAILKSTGVDVSRLKLELTESLLVDNVQHTIEKMFALKANGVGFSLDDFGTGYSSLSYLKRLPLDQLKIDQSFVRDVLIDPNDAAIAKTIVALAQSLGLGVIAEGVETEAQRDFLTNAGCHCYQGYFFSRPIPVDEFEKFAQQS